MERAERMVRDAIDTHPPFEDYRSVIRVYAKGSYANLTNVRADSDVDIVVENQDCFYYDYFPNESTPVPDLRNVPYNGIWQDPEQWRAEVVAAMKNAFPVGEVDTSGEVAMTISEVPGSRPSADVVPSYEYRRFDSPDRRVVQAGTRVFRKTSGSIDNYPAQQLTNGRLKDTDTGGRYKKFVRALKSAENYLAAEGIIEDLPSYFMECLIWNVPNTVIRTGYSLEDGFRACLEHLMSALQDDCFDDAKWDEPNGLKYLFRGNDKWEPLDGLFLAYRTWKRLGYER